MSCGDALGHGKNNPSYAGGDSGRENAHVDRVSGDDVKGGNVSGDDNEDLGYDGGDECSMSEEEESEGSLSGERAVSFNDDLGYDAEDERDMDSDDSGDNDDDDLQVLIIRMNEYSSLCRSGHCVMSWIELVCYLYNRCVSNLALYSFLCFLIGTCHDFDTDALVNEIQIHVEEYFKQHSRSETELSSCLPSGLEAGMTVHDAWVSILFLNVWYQFQRLSNDNINS